MERTEKTKVLVLGATGAMGQYLIPYLAEAGYSVDAVSLDEKQSEWPNVKYITANAKDKTVLKQLLSAKYDGIVDFMIYQTEEFGLRVDPMQFRLTFFSCAFASFCKNAGRYA